MEEAVSKASASVVARDTVRVTFPDGAMRTFARGVTGREVAESISPGLARAAVAVAIDGVLADLTLPLEADCALKIIRRQDPEGLELIRHDCAHIMAQAVQELFPGTQVTIGPNVEHGFYYDFARAQPFSTEDFSKIEKRMHEIVDSDTPIVREVWNRDEAILWFKNKGEHFKAELIADLPPTESIKVYRQGDWQDLCRGPHMPSTKLTGHGFKLMKVAGAYWRGDSTRDVLTRIYGTAWRDEKELQAHLTQIEEAEKRDHRKLGRDLGLFHLQDEAQGSVFWHPKGYTVWLALEGYIRRRIKAAGYVEVKTPQLMDKKLWEASGHWSKFRENMFVVPDEVPSVEEGKPLFSGKFDHVMALKPMNCPAHIQIFKQGVKSYRDLPLRMAEFGCCHRNEAHGALHGLMRVRQMTQDDAHIFCREDQIRGESIGFCDLLRKVYADLGFDRIKVRLATRPAVRAGEDATWDRAEAGLESALQAAGFDYDISPGEGAFYGPKLEFHLTDAIGRSWQCGTLQLDFVLPQRLDAHYVGEDGQKHHPVMLHRAILGTLERFIGILIENYAGKLPLWLAPVQCVVATITSEADAYALKVLETLRQAGVRAEIDARNEKINYKVREHSLQKTPVLFVVGAREAENGTVAIRRMDETAQPVEKLEDAVQALAQAAAAPY